MISSRISYIQREKRERKKHENERERDTHTQVKIKIRQTLLGVLFEAAAVVSER